LAHSFLMPTLQWGGTDMGLTHIRLRLANPARPRRTVSLKFLVDSGALYSVVPATVLQRLAIRPHSSRTFLLADGTQITRRIGNATFQIEDQCAASPVIFGERGDSTLLGSVSLESLGDDPGSDETRSPSASDGARSTPDLTTKPPAQSTCVEALWRESLRRSGRLAHGNANATIESVATTATY
jgi:predicted aspartyl protease